MLVCCNKKYIFQTKTKNSKLCFCEGDIFEQDIDFIFLFIYLIIFVYHVSELAHFPDKQTQEGLKMQKDVYFNKRN